MDTEIVCIIDRSGSMAPITSDTIGGFNEWMSTVAKEQAQGEAVNISITIFDNVVEKHVVSMPIRSCPKLGTAKNPYFARGSTALLDAVGATLSEAKARVPKGKRGIALIITDGQENASYEWSKEKVSSLLASLDKSKRWSIVYMGSGIDAWSNARMLYAGTVSTQTVSYSPVETRSAYTANAQAVAGLMHTNSAHSAVLGAETAKAMGQPDPTAEAPKPKRARKVTK